MLWPLLTLGCEPGDGFGPWDDDLFARANAEDRLVLLSIGTSWCHWCHVMDETTWRDPVVRDVVAEGFVAVRVDAESRPDLAARYEDYGWPATIVLGADGSDLVRFRGYVPPERMADVLAAVRADPTPGPSVDVAPPPSAGGMDDALRAELHARVYEGWDDVEGGWGRATKSLDPGLFAWAVRAPSPWPERARRLVGSTVTHLVDPVWGGGYQYSDAGVWHNPHFEKIAWVQAADLMAFSYAEARWGDEQAAKGGRDIVRYLDGFLRLPDGAFATSQDADLVPGHHAAEYFGLDDAQRRERGVPSVDVSCWPRENGLIIEALAWRAMWLGDAASLERARTAWEAVTARYPRTGRGYERAGGPFLGDVSAMGRAAWALWQATGDDRFLGETLAHASTLKQWESAAGYVSTATPGPLAAVVPFDENVELARWARDLAAVDGRGWTEVSSAALRGASDRARAPRLHVGGLLLADVEASRGPVDVRVVGPNSTSLWRAALAVPTTDRVVRWWDGRGDAPSWAVDLPPVHDASAFLCADGSCVELRDAHSLATRWSG